MDVTVSHTSSGRSCVVAVSDTDTVLDLKARALEAIFGDTTAHRGADVEASIEGQTGELDNAQRMADVPLEGGGDVRLVERWLNVKAPAEYECTSSSHIAVSSCGRLCSVGRAEGHISVFDTTTADLVASLRHGSCEIHCTAFSTCGTWLATCSAEDGVCVWLTATWEKVHLLDEHTDSVWSAAWTRSGRLLSGDASGVVNVWDFEGTPRNTALEQNMTFNCHIFGVAASDTRIFAGSGDGNIYVWDLASLTLTDTLDDHTSGIHNITLTDDGRCLVSSSLDRLVKVWCTSSLACIRTIEISMVASLVAVSRWGDILALGRVDAVALLRLSTGELLGKMAAQGNGVALSPCGRWVFSPHSSCVDVRSVCAIGTV